MTDGSPRRDVDWNVIVFNDTITLGSGVLGIKDKQDVAVFQVTADEVVQFVATEYPEIPPSGRIVQISWVYENGIEAHATLSKTDDDD